MRRGAVGSALPVVPPSVLVTGGLVASAGGGGARQRPHRGEGRGAVRCGWLNYCRPLRMSTAEAPGGDTRGN